MHEWQFCICDRLRRSVRLDKVIHGCALCRRSAHGRRCSPVFCRMTIFARTRGPATRSPSSKSLMWGSCTKLSIRASVVAVRCCLLCEWIAHAVCRQERPRFTNESAFASKHHGFNDVGPAITTNCRCCCERAFACVGGARMLCMLHSQGAQQLYYRLPTITGLIILIVYSAELC